MFVMFMNFLFSIKRRVEFVASQKSARMPIKNDDKPSVAGDVIHARVSLARA